MKVQIEGTNEYVEIGQYRAVDKGSLRAFFSIVEHPSGRKTLDCKMFESNGRKWVAFPQKEIKGQDGAKSEYIPLISYLNKDYLKSLTAAVMKAIENHQESHVQGKTNDIRKTAKETPKKQVPFSFLGGDASDIWQ